MFTFYRNTKDREHLENEAEMMDKMEEEKTSIEYEDFIKQVDDSFQDILKDLGYQKTGLDIKDDWHVSYSESKLGTFPCLIFGHSECDFIFLQPEHAQLHGEIMQPEADPKEWIRATHFGRTGQDPRY